MASKSRRNHAKSLRPSKQRRTNRATKSHRSAGRALSVEMVENRLLMTATGFSADVAQDPINAESDATVSIVAQSNDQDTSDFRRDTAEVNDQVADRDFDLVLDDQVTPLLTNPLVEIRLNHDMDTVTETVLPELAEDLELEHYSVSDIPITSGTVPNLVTDTLLRCHRDYDWELNLKSLTVNTPVDSDTFDVRFKNGNEIELDADMEDFSVSATLEFDWPKNDTWWCDNFGSNIYFATTVTVSGLDAELDVIVDADETTSSIDIVDIDKFELELDDVDFADSFLNNIVDGVLTIGETVGLLDCGDLDECINDEIDKELENDGEIQDLLQDMINSFIDTSLEIGGTVDTGDVELTYAVGLEDVETSGPDDRLSTFWNIDVSSDEDAHYCAEDLTRRLYSAPTDYTTGEDVEAVIPFGVITDTMYEVGQQGIFCTDFDVEHDGVQLSAAVKPNGAVTVTSGAESGWTAQWAAVDTSRAASPTVGGVASPNEPISLTDSESLIFTIPMAVDVTGAGDTGTLDSIPGVPGIIGFDLPYDFDAEVTGELVVTAMLSTSDTDGLELLFESIDVRNLDTTVSVDVGPVSVDVDSADLSAWIEDALDAQLDRDLPVLPLLPHVIDLDATGKYELQLNEVDSDGNSIAVGFSIEIDNGPVDSGGTKGGNDGGVGPTTPPSVDLPPLEWEDPTWQTVDGNDSQDPFDSGGRSQSSHQHGSEVPGVVMDADAIDLVIQNEDAGDSRHDEELFGALEADLILVG